MSLLPIKSFRLRIAIFLFAGFIVLLSTASTAIYFISRNILVKDFDARLFAKAQAATASISQKGADLDVDWSELPQDLNPRKHSPDAIQLSDSYGRLYFKDSPLPGPSMPPSSERTYENVTLPNLGNFRVLTLSFLPRIEEEDTTVTPPSLRKNCVLVIAGDLSALNHTLYKLAAVLAAMTGGTSLASMLLVWVVLRRALRPLDDLGVAVAKVEATSLGQSIHLDDVPEELAPVVSKLNQLMQRLDYSFARERRFSADVSHELRTPVAELKTLSEVMLRETGHSPEIEQAFRDARDIAVQMESLTTALLEMVRQEEGRDFLLLSKTDLTLQVKAAWQRLEAKAATKRIRFTLTPPDEPLWLFTEPRLLSMVLSNLLDNAVEYSPVGSTIDVEFENDHGTRRLVISNPVKDIVISDLPHLFERFWRKDKARGESPHLGIGLALTRALCQRIDILLTVSLDDANRIRFWLHFLDPETSEEK